MSHWDHLLPPDGNIRWTFQRKGNLLQAIDRGAITVDQAMSRYRISGEEMAAWRLAYDAHGYAGLKALSLGTAP